MSDGLQGGARGSMPEKLKASDGDDDPKSQDSFVYKLLEWVEDERVTLTLGKDVTRLAEGLKAVEQWSQLLK